MNLELSEPITVHIGWIPVEISVPAPLHPFDQSTLEQGIQDCSKVVWVRYESKAANKEVEAEYSFVLGRCEWKLKGVETYPDAEREIENPVCRIKWERGGSQFVDIFTRRVIKATHWHDCERPIYPSGYFTTYNASNIIWQAP